MTSTPSPADSPIAASTDARHGWTFVVAWSNDAGGSAQPMVLVVPDAEDFDDAFGKAAEHLAQLHNAENDEQVPAHEVFPSRNPDYSAIAHVVYAHPGVPTLLPQLKLELDSIRVHLDAAPSVDKSEAATRYEASGATR